MYYAYIKQYTDEESIVDNSRVFKLAQDLGLNEDCIFADEDGSREQLVKLILGIAVDDCILVRSVVDLADEHSELLKLLKGMQEAQITLISTVEPFFNGKEYYTTMRGFVDIHKCYVERKRKLGFEEAKQAGTVGRPRMTEEVERAIRLYDTKAFSTAEIERFSGVSSSTLYRYLKNRE